MRFIIFLLFFSANLCAQDLSPAVKARSDLMNLLQERKTLFDNYSASLRERSGIFGQRTKTDLRETQSKLQEIVDADNRIISALNRMLDYKNFEKLNLTYSANTNEERLTSLQQLSDTLTKQMEFLKAENKRLQAETRHSNFYIFLLLLLAGGTAGKLFMNWKKAEKRKAPDERETV